MFIQRSREKHAGHSHSLIALSVASRACSSASSCQPPIPARHLRCGFAQLRQPSSGLRPGGGPAGPGGAAGSARMGWKRVSWHCPKARHLPGACVRGLLSCASLWPQLVLCCAMAGDRRHNSRHVACLRAQSLAAQAKRQGTRRPVGQIAGQGGEGGSKAAALRAGRELASKPPLQHGPLGGTQWQGSKGLSGSPCLARLPACPAHGSTRLMSGIRSNSRSKLTISTAPRRRTRAAW